MALTLPTNDEFYSFWGTEADEVDDDRATLLIELAGNLLWLATGLDKDPIDPRLAQLVKYAICDMAIYVYVTRDDINASYAPFQSERIGSYSYSKQYAKLTQSVSMNQPTGVPLFDRVVMELMDLLTYGGGTVVAGERVFREHYIPLAYEVYTGWGNADIDTGLYR